MRALELGHQIIEKIALLVSLLVVHLYLEVVCC